MCEDHVHVGAGGGPGLSRRRVLQGAVSVAGLAGLAACAPEKRTGPALLPAARPTVPAGLTAYVMAMHVHASASEGVGSTRAHLSEAAANGFDVVWFTEHDGLRRGMFRRSRYHFLPEDRAAGGTWRLPALPSVGSLLPGSGGQLVSDPASPSDTAREKGSLRLRAVSKGADAGGVGHRLDSESGSRMNLRGRLHGRAVAVDVLLTAGGPGAWGEVVFGLSQHPAAGSRPAGEVEVRYRFRSDITAHAVTSDGTTATVDVPVPVGTWQTIRFDVMADLEAAWPDMDPRDNSLHELEFHAWSRERAPAEVFFSFLRFEDQGVDALGVEQQLLTAYAEQEPGVLGLIGTELSVGPHVNQYGGPQLPYNYGPVNTLSERTGEIRASLVDFIHRQGGLASLNHPFLPSEPWTSQADEDVTYNLLAVGGAGADILEVGYGTLLWAPAHLAVWDAMSRNGLFLTGNGVTDDHTAQDWAEQAGRFYTSAWASGLSEASLLDPLGRGRVYVGYLGAFGGTIDMTLDDDVPMGAVSVSPQTTRELHLDVTGVPEGGAVEILRGLVDYAGTGEPRPNTTVLTTLGARDLASGSPIPLDTADDCFVRLQVVDGAGDVVAFGQPIWSLQNPPPQGVPRNRQVAG